MDDKQIQLQKDIPEPTTPTGSDKPTPTETIKSLRTYESDVADLMSHKRTSVASIAIAENDRAKKEGVSTEPDEPTHLTRNLTITLISLVLVVTGLGGAYYLYSQSPLGTKAPVATSTPIQSSVGIINADSVATIQIDELSANAILDRIQNEASKPQAENSIKEIVLTNKINNQTFRVPAPRMLDIMKIQAPDILERSLDNSWMLGTYNDNNNNKSIFVISKNNFFQNTFSGILQWESLMPDDLKQFLYRSPVADIANVSSSTTVASSTIDENYPTYFTLRGQFLNKIINNKDVREFVTPDGRILLIYSFIDSSTLIMTNNEATLIAVLDRLEKQAYLR